MNCVGGKQPNRRDDSAAPRHMVTEPPPRFVGGPPLVRKIRGARPALHRFGWTAGAATTRIPASVEQDPSSSAADAAISVKRVAVWRS